MTISLKVNDVIQLLFNFVSDHMVEVSSFCSRSIGNI
jgi:hypothetical protein